MKSKDSTHFLFGTLLAVTVIGSLIWFYSLSQKSKRDARVAEYAASFEGRRISVTPDRGFALPLALISIAAIAILAVWWISKLRQIDEHNSATPDEKLLDKMFNSENKLVTYQVGKSTMSHAVVVMGAKARGYRVTSQGADGSLVFEPNKSNEM